MTPSARLDHTRTNGDQISYSLGATWKLTDNTLLRAFTGRGYGVPVVTITNQPAMFVWTSQLGVESTDLPYLWLKGTLFRNQTWGEAVEQHIALGTELEARTAPVLNTSLGAGYTFTDTTRTKDGAQVNYMPRHTVQLSLRYNDGTFRSILTGRHIFWNSPPEDNGRYGGLIWDLHLGAVLFKRDRNSLELFFSGHNLFNSDQYFIDLIPNTGRWFEGGVRVRF